MAININPGDLDTILSATSSHPRGEVIVLTTKISHPCYLRAPNHVFHFLMLNIITNSSTRQVLFSSCSVRS